MRRTVRHTASSMELMESRRLYSVTVSAVSFNYPQGASNSHVFATFVSTDAGKQQPGRYTATVSFGDGASGRGHVVKSGAGFEVLASHNYKKEGTFTYAVTIHDRVGKTSATGAGSAVITSSSGARYTDLGVDESSIFSSTYGGTFRQSGLNYTNGVVTAKRVSDNDDQVWSAAGGIAGARVVAAYSSDAEILGYLPGAAGGNFTPLFTVSGENLAVTGSCGAVAMTHPFRLARSGSGNTFSSKSSQNPDGRDHLITYQLSGLPGQSAAQKTYLLFWEDSVAPRADFDFNDLVVELKTKAM